LVVPPAGVGRPIDGPHAIGDRVADTRCTHRLEEDHMPRHPGLMAVSILALTLLCGGPAATQPASTDAMNAARELVVTMRAADQLKLLLPAIMQQLKPAIAQGRPQVEQDFDAVMPHLMEVVDARSGEFVEAVAVIYARNFTADEIREVTAFYRGKVGQKFLEKMPTVTQESMVMGQKFGQTIAAELRTRMIEELRKRGHKI
jgi:hypothetical protein